MARIKLRKSHNGARTYDKESDSYSVSGAFSYFTADGAKRTLNGTQSVGTYALPQDPMRNEKFKETFNESHPKHDGTNKKSELNLIIVDGDADFFFLLLFLFLLTDDKGVDTLVFFFLFFFATVGFLFTIFLVM